MGLDADAIRAEPIEPIEPIPGTSAAERVVADALPIGASVARAERVRDSVPLWFHTFALAPGIYTPGIARDHAYRLPVLGADRLSGRSVLDLGTFDGFYSFLAEARGAPRVVAVDNEQYVEWVHARFGVTLPGAAGFRAVAELLDSRVEYHRMDALDVRRIGERFDVMLCFGILHRVTDPVGLLRTLAGVLTPGGEVVLETYGSRLSGDTPAIEVHRPGEVYPRDNFVYWGFPAEGLCRLGQIVGLADVAIIDQADVDGHPRIVATLRTGH
jgi:tRNA (mo5U34)-methyltransferase